MKLISRSSSGAIANGKSSRPAISADGRFVAFVTRASNLSSKVSDTSTSHVYLRDRKKGTTRLVSRNDQGFAGDDHSYVPAISPDGKFIAYASEATNLSNRDENGVLQVFLFNRITKKTSLMSRNNDGAAGNGPSTDPALSRKAERVVFSSDATNFGKSTNGTADAYMRDRQARKTRRVSLNWKGKQLNDGEKSAETTAPDISANGRMIVFESRATNALKGTPPPGMKGHVYARHLGSGKLTRLSRRSAAGNADSVRPRISADGEFAAFGSDATNLIKGGDANGSDDDVFRRGRL